MKNLLLSLVEEIIIYTALILAVFFLLRKFIFKRKNKNCKTDCGCS